MSASKKGAASRNTIDTQELREQEVLRANRELAAYFKGRRTEREARAALKIVKAFIRDREHTDPLKRRPLPGVAPEPRPKKAAARKTSGTTKGRRRTVTPRRPRSTAPTAPATDASAASSAHEDRVGEQSVIHT